MTSLARMTMNPTQEDMRIGSHAKINRILAPEVDTELRYHEHNTLLLPTHVTKHNSCHTSDQISQSNLTTSR